MNPQTRRFLLSLPVVLSLAGCRYQPAQLGTNREITQTVDAIAAAIEKRDPNQINQCKFRVETLQTDGKIQPAAAAALLSYIAVARGGDWNAARTKLKTFLAGQER